MSFNFETRDAHGNACAIGWDFADGGEPYIAIEIEGAERSFWAEFQLSREKWDEIVAALASWRANRDLHSCGQCGWSGSGFHACPGPPGENEF